MRRSGNSLSHGDHACWFDSCVIGHRIYSFGVQQWWHTKIVRFYSRLVAPVHCTVYSVQYTIQHRRRINTEEKKRQRSSLLRRGRNCFNSLPLFYCTPGWFEEKDEYNNSYLANWMLWKNGWWPYQTTTMASPKMDVLPKTCLQIILAAKYLLRHSSTSLTSSYDLCLIFCIYPSSMSMLSLLHHL